jgi:hypothetical protein
MNIWTKGNLECQGDPLDLVTSSMIKGMQMGGYLDWVGW